MWSSRKQHLIRTLKQRHFIVDSTWHNVETTSIQHWNTRLWPSVTLNRRFFNVLCFSGTVLATHPLKLLFTSGICGPRISDDVTLRRDYDWAGYSISYKTSCAPSKVWSVSAGCISKMLYEMLCPAQLSIYQHYSHRPVSAVVNVNSQILPCYKNKMVSYGQIQTTAHFKLWANTNTRTQISVQLHS